jgi:hypothetical protein
MPELCADHEFDRKELRADHVIVLTALQQNACALPDASEELHADPTLLCRAHAHCGRE